MGLLRESFRESDGPTQQGVKALKYADEEEEEGDDDDEEEEWKG